MIGPGLQESVNIYGYAKGMSNEAVEYIRGIPVKTFSTDSFSFDRFHQSINNYEKFCSGYTNKMRFPMTLFTTAFINSIFIFIISTMMLLILNGFDLNSLKCQTYFMLFLHQLLQ